MFMAAAGIALASLTLETEAAVITSLDPVAPTENIIASYLPIGDPSSFSFRRQSGGVQYAGQTFTISDNAVLTNLVFRTTENNDLSASGSFTLNIYQSPTNPTAPTSGTRVHTEAVTVTLPAHTGASYLNIALDTGVELQEGFYYTFTMVWSSVDTANRIILQQGSSDPDQPTFHRWHNTGSSWSSHPNNLVFYAIGTQVIPEPGTVALLLPLVAVGTWHLFRRRSIA